MDDLKLCPGPQDVSWVPGVPTITAKSLCAITVAFRPGSHVSDMTPDPSVDVSGWEDRDDIHTDSNVLKDLDRPIDLTGHVLSTFYLRHLDYQDSRLHSIAHLMCCRYARANAQKAFATGIRKWSKHLTEFPTPKFKTLDCVQQWQSVLVDIYSHLCLTDVSFKTMLINTGRRPFTLHCMKPWGCVPNDPDTCPRADLINDILVSVRVLSLHSRCDWSLRNISATRCSTRFFHTCAAYSTAILERLILYFSKAWTCDNPPKVIRLRTLINRPPYTRGLSISSPWL